MEDAPRSQTAAYSEDDWQRDEIWARDVTDATQRPEFVRFMEALLTAQSATDGTWSSWEYDQAVHPLSPQMLEQARDTLGSGSSGSGPGGAGGHGTGDPEPSLQELVQQLGLADGLTEDRRAALAAAPEVTDRLVGELEAALEGMGPGREGTGCLSQ